MLRAAFVLCVCLGCISTGRATLDETAALYHDDLRWGRLPAAETSVDPRMRAAFVQHHRAWGAQVRLMDLEVDAVRTASDTGTLRIRVTWTPGGDSTDVRESVVEEAWTSVGGNWRLRSEQVIAGDAGLFGVTPAADAPATAPPAAAGAPDAG